MRPGPRAARPPRRKWGNERPPRRRLVSCWRSEDMRPGGKAVSVLPQMVRDSRLGRAYKKGQFEASWGPWLERFLQLTCKIGTEDRK